MLFLIDAQLPPSLAAALREAGCDAIHVDDLGMLAATDRQIWDVATSRAAVLVTKDRDFPMLRATSNDGPPILWVRVGNTGNRALISQITRALPAIRAAVERGEAVIEFVGRGCKPRERGDMRATETVPNNVTLVRATLVSKSYDQNRRLIN